MCHAFATVRKSALTLHVCRQGPELTYFGSGWHPGPMPFISLQLEMLSVLYKVKLLYLFLFLNSPSTNGWILFLYQCRL